MRVFALCAFFLLPLIAGATEPVQTQYTDPLALLQAVAEKYATGADTFRMEAVRETLQDGPLQHRWEKVEETAIKGDGARYRIETQSSHGSFVQDSDGKTEWIYLREANLYVKRPLPKAWPGFARFEIGASGELESAWNMRTMLEADAAGYKRAVMLPEESIQIEGKTYRCYVVSVTSEDKSGPRRKDYSEATQYWIDRSALVFRKSVSKENSSLYFTASIHIPYKLTVTTEYPVVDFSPRLTSAIFQFSPPAGAQQVATFEPKMLMPPKEEATGLKVGAPAPDLHFRSTAETTTALSSYRGKPVLLDFWASWCGPCLLSLPALQRIDSEDAAKGLVVLTVDEDSFAKAATQYLARHHYTWTNYHDAGGSIETRLQGKMIPFTILIDAQGKIVFADYGPNEEALRAAIATLGPPFDHLSPTSTR